MIYMWESEDKFQGSVLSFYWRLNSSHRQAWQQAPLPGEPLRSSRSTLECSAGLFPETMALITFWANIYSAPPSPQLEYSPDDGWGF